jgi:hypothetical protein
MKVSHISDTTALSNRIADQMASVPPPVDDTPSRLPSRANRPRRPGRNLAIVMTVLGALVVAIPLAVWAIAGGRNNSPGTTPSTTSSTTQAQAPSASVAGSPSTFCEAWAASRWNFSATPAAVAVVADEGGSACGPRHGDSYENVTTTLPSAVSADSPPTASS